MIEKMLKLLLISSAFAFTTATGSVCAQDKPADSETESEQSQPVQFHSEKWGDEVGN